LGFVDVDIEFVVYEPFEDCFDQFSMLFRVLLRVYENVVEIDHYFLVEQILEKMGNESLSCCGCVGQSHEHDQPFKMFVASSKSCLPFFFFLHAYSVIGFYYVELCEFVCFM